MLVRGRTEGLSKSNLYSIENAGLPIAGTADLVHLPVWQRSRRITRKSCCNGSRQLAQDEMQDRHTDNIVVMQWKQSLPGRKDDSFITNQ